MTGDRPDRVSGADLALRVYGLRADGRPFSQQAHATNLSHEGALIFGLEHELKVGDTIGLQYEDKKVRCRVVWVINAGPTQKNQVGVQLLDGQECPWEEALSTVDLPRPATNTDSLSPQNRRRFHRHKLSFTMELRDERANAPMRVSATDVSGNGCYIETILPLPKCTRLRADFWIGSDKISTPAIVRTCDGGVGMGIEFVGMEADTRKLFQNYLDALEAGNDGDAQAKEHSQGS